MTRPEDIEFLEQHEAVVHFAAGRKVGIDLRRPDGLRVQCSDWTIEKTIERARRLARGERA